MEKFIRLKSLVAPLDRANVDTDAIIPKQFLKSIKRTGFGVNLFDAWRYLDPGEPGVDIKKRRINPDFVLNKRAFAKAKILLSRENFGCGSSREHAPWALADYGFKVIIAPSFADIFYNNSLKNGLLPIVLPTSVVDGMFDAISSQVSYELVVDLNEKTVQTSEGVKHGFEIDDFRRDCLLKGLDDIGLTLTHADAIKDFENKQKTQQPWLYQ